MTVGGEFEIVSEIQSGSAHDSDAAKARIVRAFPNDLADSFVAPIQGHLVNEVAQHMMEIHVRSGPRWRRCASVTKCASVGGQTISKSVTQDIAPIELIEPKSALSP